MTGLEGYFTLTRVPEGYIIKSKFIGVLQGSLVCQPPLNPKP